MMTVDKIKDILAAISFNDWSICVRGDDANMYLQVQVYGKCNVSGKAFQWGGRKWRLSKFMTKSEIVTTAFKAVLTATEHETREQFKYKGVSIFDPHYDVEQLVALRIKDACLDERD